MSGLVLFPLDFPSLFFFCSLFCFILSSVSLFPFLLLFMPLCEYLPVCTVCTPIVLCLASYPADRSASGVLRSSNPYHAWRLRCWHLARRYLSVVPVLTCSLSVFALLGCHNCYYFCSVFSCLPVYFLSTRAPWRLSSRVASSIPGPGPASSRFGPELTLLIFVSLRRSSPFHFFIFVSSGD